MEAIQVFVGGDMGIWGRTLIKSFKENTEKILASRIGDLPTLTSHKEFSLETSIVLNHSIQ